VADAVSLDRFQLVGECGGAGIALAAAAALPERIASLALVSPSAPLNGPGADAYLNENLRKMRGYLRFGPIARLAARAQCRAYRRDPEKALDQGWRTLPAEDRVYVTGARRRVTRLEADEMLGSPDVYLAEWSSVRGPWNINWSRIRIPVVIDHGELDQTWPADMARWLGSVMPQARLTINPRRGHYLSATDLAALLNNADSI
jgi:pimeloyl-ACP methyl ester carboxylesterase